MMYFSEIRTKRLTVKLRELTIGQSLKLAAIPIQSAELTCTEFLRCAIESVKGTESPIDWTIQERYFAVSHYLASLSEHPDFALSQGKYSDYLDIESDVSAAMNQVDVCELGGDKWAMTHLTGRMAEAIERLVGELPLKGRSHWLICAMAAQLIRKGELLPESQTDSEYDEWLTKRVNKFLSFPESDFEVLMMQYRTKSHELHHIFSIDFDDDGIVILPKKESDGKLPPARFRVNSCLSRLARQLAG